MTTMNDLADVNITDPQENDRLIYINGFWVNRPSNELLAARVHRGGWELEIDVLEANAAGVFDPGKISIESPDLGFDANGAQIVRWRTIRATAARRQVTPNINQRFQTTAGGITTFRATLDRPIFAKAKRNTLGQSGNSGFDPVLHLQAGWFTIAGEPAPALSGIRVTNNSTRPYPVPGARSFLPPNRLMGANGLVEITGNSVQPGEGKVFACVRVDRTGVTSGVTRTDYGSVMSASTAFPRRTNAVPVFAIPLDYTPFQQGEEIIHRYRAYPLIGDAPRDSQGGGLYEFANESHWCDKNGTYGWVIAVVDPATGNDTTGAVATASTLAGKAAAETAAAATPFATDRAALFRALQANVATFGRNNQSGIEICFSNTTHTPVLDKSVSGTGTPANFDATEMPKGGPWLIYRPRTGATNCRLQRNAAIVLGWTVPRRTCLTGFAGLDVLGVPSGTPGLINGGEVQNGSYGQEIWIDNSPFVDAQGTTSTAYALFQGGRVYMTNCNQPALGPNAWGQNSVPNEFMLVRDTDWADLRVAPDVYAVGGCSIRILGGNTQFAERTQGVVNLGKPALDNPVWAGVTIRHSHGTTPFAYGRNRQLNTLSVLNMLIETFGGSTAPSTETVAANVRAYNFFHDYMTVVGGRMLIGYEDSFTMTDDGDPEQQLKEWLVFRRSVLFEIDTKVDTHNGPGGPNPARIHTWNVAHRVGWEHVRVMRPGSDGQTTPGPARWIGEAFPATVTYIGPDARAQFENYQARHVSPNVAGAGNGNYVPAAGSGLLAQFTPEQEACTVDTVGTPRRGAIGAYERPL